MLVIQPFRTLESSMNPMSRFAVTTALLLAAAPGALASTEQQPQPASTIAMQATASTAQQQSKQKPEQKPEQQPEQKPEQKPEEAPRYEETVVVSASKTEEKLINAPSTMSVITTPMIEAAPTQN